MSRNTSVLKDHRIELSNEVADALRRGRPVVALESTVLTHGLPHPDNLRAARSQIEAIAASGAIAATIGIREGRIVVGLTEAERAELCAGAARKVSASGISAAVATGSSGGTTVSGTIAVARLAGIRVASTGGIGGVHPGGVDVSADLLELSRTPMIVVCSGPKSILDVPATREALESLSIPVLGWRTEALPAFFIERSGLPADHRVDSAAEVADIWRAHRALERPGALLVCVPPPRPIAPEALAEWLSDVHEAEGSGAARTPALLGDLHRRSGGVTVEANLGLLEENARVAGLIAQTLR